MSYTSSAEGAKRSLTSKNSMRMGFAAKAGNKSTFAKVKSAEESVSLDSDNMAPPTTTSAKIYDLWFGTLFLMVHGNSQFYLWDYVGMIVEDLQLISWAFSIKLEINSMPNFIASLLNIFEYRGSSADSVSDLTILIMFALAAGGLFLMLLLLASVAIACYNGKFTLGLTIRLLRKMAFVIPTVLYVPMINTFLSYFNFLGILFTILMIFPCLLLNFMFYESNPTEKRPQAKIHGRVDLWYCLIKTVVIVTWRYWMLRSKSMDGVLTTAGVTLCCAWLSGIMLYYLPYYDARVNYIRFGLFFTAFGVNFIGFINTSVYYWFPNAEKSNAVMIVMFLVLVPFWAAGYQICKWYHERLINRVEKKLAVRHGENTGKRDKALTIVYNYWTEVEICSRYIVKDFSHRVRYFNFKKEWESFVLRFEQGLHEFPKDKFLLVSYGLYLNQMVDSSFDGTPAEKVDRKHIVNSKLLNTAKVFFKFRERAPAWDIDFMIYYMERSLAQKRAVLELGEDLKMDVAEYANYKKNEKLAAYAHDRGCKTILKCWKHILIKDYDPIKLGKYGKIIYESASQARDAYGELIKKFPKSPNILRRYAKFLMDLGNEPYKAAVILRKADELEAEAAGHLPSNTLLGKQASFLKSLEEENPQQNVAGESKGREHSMIKEAANIGGASPFEIAENGSGALEEDQHFKGSDHETRLEKKESSSVHSSENGRELKRELENKTARATLTSKSNQSLRLLSIQNLFTLLMTLGLFVANFAVVYSIIQYTTLSSEYEMHVFERDFNTSDLLYCAQMRWEAFEAKDKSKYEFYGARMSERVQGLAKYGRDFLYAERNQEDAKLETLWTVPSVRAKFSYLPAKTEKEVGLVSLYELIDLYVSNGRDLSAIRFEDAAPLDENNHYRFLVDNFMQVQEIYESSRHMFLESVSANDHQSQNIVLILSLVQIVAMGILIIILDVSLNSAYRRQTRVLQIFRHIPHHTVKEMIKDLEQDQDDMMGSAGDISTGDTKDDAILDDNDSSSWFSGIWVFRWRYIGYFIGMTSILAAFCVFNYRSIDDIAIHYSMMVEFGDTLTYGVRAAAMAKELGVQDDLTWESVESLNIAFSKTFNKLDYAHSTIINGDLKLEPPGPSLDELPTEILAIWQPLQPTCVVENATLCNDKNRLNKSIGFTEDIAHKGLGAIVRSYVMSLTPLVLASDEQVEHEPGEKLYQFIEAVLKYDYVSGLRKCLHLLEEEVLHVTASANLVNIGILAGGLVFIIVSYLLVFQSIIYYLKRRNKEIAELILFVPNEISKKTPQINQYLITGELSDKDEEGLKKSKDAKPDTKQDTNKKNQIAPMT